MEVDELAAQTAATDRRCSEIDELAAQTAANAATENVWKLLNKGAQSGGALGEGTRLRRSNTTQAKKHEAEKHEAEEHKAEKYKAEKQDSEQQQPKQQYG